MFINSLKNGAFQVLEDSQKVSESYRLVHLMLVIGLGGQSIISFSLANGKLLIEGSVDLAQESLHAPSTCAAGKREIFSLAGEGI